LTAERRNGDFVRGLIERGELRTCHDLSDGGLLIGLAEMALAGGMGAEVDLPGGLPAFAAAFGEDQGRYVVALPVAQAATMLKAAGLAGVPALAIGATGAENLTVRGEITISLTALRQAFEAWLPGYMDTP
jgi:phosphoribosylformylglycinamidine synthase